MKKLRILLCGLGVSFILSGCGAMPELTEEENEIITEYAVGLLLKYDKYYNSRLVDLTAYEEQQDIEQSEPEESNIPEEEPLPEDNEELSQSDPEVVDVSEQQASTIEEFYGIEGFSFQYTGCDLKSEYPDMSEDSADAYFAVQATPGTQLLILKFQVNNYSGSDRELDMSSCGLRARVAVNGESSQNALSTMLLNDLRTYKGVVGENDSTELVAIIEVPEGTYVESLSLILRRDSDSVEFVLQ